MINPRRILPLLLLSLFAASCIPARSEQISPVQPTSTSDSNATIKLDLIPIAGVTELRKNKLIVLDLVNKSQSTILFPSDYGIEVYVRSNGNWLPIKNNYGYASESILLAPAGNSAHYYDANVPLYPLVDNSNEPVTIKVVVAGHVYADNRPTSRQVTADAELTLQP